MQRTLALAALLSAVHAPLSGAQSESARIYVQRIEFVGTDRINDEVLRKQLLQLEGTYLNTVALEQSRLRLERLPYVAKAEVKRVPDANTKDQETIVFTITDAPARKYGIGGGYSESQRASVNGFFVNDNLLGSGQRLAARIETSDIRTSADLAHTDPFAHANDIGRTVAFAYRDMDQLTVDASELDTQVFSGRLDYRYPIAHPIAERQSIRFGISIQDVELVTGATTSNQLTDWVSSNGDLALLAGFPSTDYLTAELTFGWRYDTRKGGVFPESGLEQELAIRATVPGSDVGYVTAEYEVGQYWPLGGGWVARFGATLGYGESVGSDATTLPPNLNWFAGGPGTVRGYREQGLGPKDSLGNPYGGNFVTAARMEIFAPLPEKWKKRVQLGLFYDIGNVFSTENIEFLDDDGATLDYGFDIGELRQSAGAAARLVLPIGVLGLSYGIPLNDDRNNPNRFLRDDVENFQVTIGVEF